MASSKKPSLPPRVTHETGDLLTCPEAFICHGCNAQGVMGSGVAKLIRAAHPDAFRVYREAYEAGGSSLPLGSFTSVESGGKTIINAVTQEFYGSDPEIVYVSYAAIFNAFYKLNAFAPLIGNVLAIPRIGAGLANGSWPLIEEVLLDAVRNYTVKVYTLPDPSVAALPKPLAGAAQ